MCLGLDPDPGPATAVTERCLGLIESAGASCVAIKPQLACFERLGPSGWEALAQTVAAAQRAGLLVIADGKRGDVPHTASIYAENLVGTTGDVGAPQPTRPPSIPSWAATRSMRSSTSAEPAGAGLFVLVRTRTRAPRTCSTSTRAAAPLFERIAALVAVREERLAGEGGLSGMGAVAGATEPRHLARLRELMPRAIFLIPGVGAQGGKRPISPGARAASRVDPGRGIPLDRRSTRPGQAAEELRAELWALN